VGMDDTVRAASDAIDAYCAANPKSEWPPRVAVSMPAGIVHRSVLDTSDACREAIVELAAASSASLGEVRDALEAVILDYATSPKGANG